MIKQLKIENFKRFESIEFNNFKQFNLITGNHNVGKTTLLEAITLFSVHDENIESIFAINQLRGYSPSLELFSTLFNDDNKVIRFSDDVKALTITPYKDENDIKKIVFSLMENNTEYALSSIEIDNDSFLCNDSNEHESNNILYFYADKSSTTLTDYEQYNQLNQEKKKKVMYDMKLIFPGLDDIVNHNNILYCNYIGKRIMLPMMGHGFNKIFTILIGIYYIPGINILLIDDVENGIGPYIINRMWKILFKICRELNIQLFATTYSYENISSFVDNAHLYKKNIKLYRIEDADDYKGSKVIAYKYEDIKISVKARWEIR